MRLHQAIKINSIYSALNGITAIFFAEPIANFMGIIDPLAITLVGIALLLFCILLVGILRTEVINIRLARYVIVLDWLWVVGSLILIVFNPYNITSGGLFLIGITALMVGLLAMLQTKAITV